MPGADGSIIIDTRILDDGFKRGIAGLKRMSAAAGKAIGVGILAASVALAAYTVSSIRAAEADRAAGQRIEAVAKAMGRKSEAAQKLADRLVDLATKTALQTGIDDTAIKNTQTKLLTFKELAKTADDVGGAFDRATQAAVDMQAAGFGQAEQNAVQLGKALQDPIKGITALARSGITFTAAEKDRIATLVESNKIGEAQALILAAIESQVGGTAEASATASERIKVAFGELSESAGQAFLPVIDAMLPELMKQVEALGPIFETTFGGLAEIISGKGSGQGFADGIGQLTTMLVEGIVTIAPTLFRAFGTMLEGIAKELPTLLPLLVDGITELIKVLAEFIPVLVPLMLPAFEALLLALADAVPVVMPVLGKAMVRLFNGLLSEGKKMEPQFRGLGVLVVIAIGQALEGGKAEVKRRIIGVGNSMLAELKKLPARALSAALGIGIAISDGIRQGLSESWGALLAKLRHLAGMLPQAVKDLLGIRSPSRVFADEIGVNMALGVGVGFAKSIPAVTLAMRRSLSSEIGRFAVTAVPSAASLVGGGSTTTNNFHGQVRTYSEMIRAQRDIEMGVAF